jgi:heme/copper-type cytochrome/quinol oxidase subunit 2
LQALRRRVAPITLVATAGALAVMPELAAADLLAPDSAASDEAGSARTLYIVMAVIAVLAVAGVLVALGRAVRSRSGAANGPVARTRGGGSVQLRVGAALSVVALVLFSVGVIWTGEEDDVPYLLSGETAEASTSGPITIQADAQQWLWRYEYPVEDPSEDGFNSDAAYSYQELTVPVDTPITLEISSVDVLHRWSVPALAPSADAVPGITNEVTFTATETGTFEGASTRFSGPGYATMRTRVNVVEPDEYEQFLDNRVAAINEARQAVQKRNEAGAAPGVELEKK